MIGGEIYASTSCGKTGRAGRNLQNPSYSKEAKSNAAKVLNQHRKAKH